MPDPGGYVEIVSEAFYLGGEAANTANALHAWQCEVLLAGNAFAQDDAGKFVSAELQARGIPLTDVHHRSAGRTPVCDIYVSDDGERTMIGDGFTAMRETVDPSKLPFQPGKWFTAEPNLGDVARDAVRLAHAAGMRCYVMDLVEPDDPVAPGDFWQSSTDWIGERGNSKRNLDVVHDLAEQRGCFAILTDGPRGFVSASPGAKAQVHQSIRVHNAVDGTGAGDLFRAGMLYGLTKGWSEDVALEFAASAGAAICSQLGATERVPTVLQVRQLLARQRIFSP